MKTELGTIYAVVFEALPGKQFEIDELQQDQYFTWGRSLGQLHSIFKNLPAEFRSKRGSWRDQLRLVEKNLPTHETAARNELSYLINRLEMLTQDKENYGMIHSDFELDNQRWDGVVVGMLDFDDCLNHWYAADIAYALRELFQDEVDLENSFYKEFIKGYRTATEIEEHLLSEIPLFLRLHNLVTFEGLLRTVDIPDSEEHPKWLKTLRLKLVNKIDEYRIFLKEREKNGTKI